MISTVIDCVDLDSEVDFFAGSLGFRVHLVTPADQPRRIVLERDGGRIELRRCDQPRPVTLVLTGDDELPPRSMTSPGGTTISLVPSTPEVAIPESVPSVSIVQNDIDGDRDGDDDGFGVGRAGMEYRDLLPDRWGGRFIASQIRIEGGGDVADWVHFHRIRFQMIYVAAGWVDVVYEDQGQPFRMEAGDCVLQPPEIRHRVLRSSPGVEVIEIGCPAEHDTIADHDLQLPTATQRGDRDFGGQRFVRHCAAAATTSTWADPAMRVRDTGIGEATHGLAGAVVVSVGDKSTASAEVTHDGEFVMIVGLTGSATVHIRSHGDVALEPSTSVALPAGSVWSWSGSTPDHEALVISLPADVIESA